MARAWSGRGERGERQADSGRRPGDVALGGAAEQPRATRRHDTDTALFLGREAGAETGTSPMLKASLSLRF